MYRNKFVVTHGVGTASGAFRLGAAVGAGCDGRLSGVGVGVWTQRRFGIGGKATNQEISAALKTLDARLDMDAKTLKKKYMELVKKHHPDKPGGCADKMKNITTAYDTLKGLTNSDRAAYNAQFGGGAGSSAGQQRPSGMYQNANARNYNRGSPQGARAAYDWQKMYEEQQRSRDFAYQYTRGHQSGNRSQDQAHIFRNMTGGLKTGLLKMPLYRIVVRVAMMYFFFTFTFLVVYRRYRDWLHEDGWRSTESINKKEQMDDLYRMRAELVEKLGKSPYMNRLIQDRQRERELMEYSQVQARQNQELQRSGFEPFSPMYGTLHREQQDPDGVVYFEPRVEVHGPHTMAGVPPPDPRTGRPQQGVQMDRVPPHLAAGRQDAMSPPRFDGSAAPSHSRSWGGQSTNYPDRSSHYTHQAAQDPRKRDPTSGSSSNSGEGGDPMGDSFRSPMSDPSWHPRDTILPHTARDAIVQNSPYLRSLAANPERREYDSEREYQTKKRIVGDNPTAHNWPAQAGPAGPPLQPTGQTAWM